MNGLHKASPNESAVRNSTAGSIAQDDNRGELRSLKDHRNFGFIGQCTMIAGDSNSLGEK